MNDETNGRLGRLETDVSEIKTAQVEIKTAQVEIKTTLARLEPLLMSVFQGQARLEGRLTEIPTVRDFGNLEGQMMQLGQRISDINARLPVPIGYNPPKSSAA